jgi:hypothetical protein
MMPVANCSSQIAWRLLPADEVRISLAEASDGDDSAC